MRFRVIAAGVTCFVVGCSALTSFDNLVGDASDAGRDATSDATGFSDGSFDAGISSDSMIDVSAPDVLTLPYLVVEDIVLDPNDVVDLTTVGTIDWRHWGTEDAKNAATHLIGEIQNAPNYYDGDPRLFSWTDGAKNAESQNVQDGLFASSGAMTLSVISSPTPRVLKIYFGNYVCDSQLNVTLGDASVSKSFTGVSGGGGLQTSCVIHFAADDTVPLEISWSITKYLDSSDNTGGNVAFSAAALSNE